MLIVSGRYLRTRRICVHGVTLRRRCVLIVLRRSVSALHHPSVVCEWLKALLHAIAGVEVAANEKEEECGKDDKDHGVSNSNAGLRRCQ